MKKLLLSLLFAFVLPAALIVSARTPESPAASKTIVKVRNSATSNGVLTFSFKPEGGIGQRIEVPVRKGWNALRVAREIASKLRTAMPTQYRATSRSHGSINCVDVEKDMMRYADFTLVHSGSTVTGISIEVEERD